MFPSREDLKFSCERRTDGLLRENISWYYTRKKLKVFYKKIPEGPLSLLWKIHGLLWDISSWWEDLKVFSQCLIITDVFSLRRAQALLWKNYLEMYFMWPLRFLSKKPHCFTLVSTCGVFWKSNLFRYKNFLSVPYFQKPGNISHHITPAGDCEELQQHTICGWNQRPIVEEIFMPLSYLLQLASCGTLSERAKTWTGKQTKN